MPNKPVKIIMLTGYLGAGKTTLLKAAAGLLPHTGQCLLNGVPLESLSTRRLAQTVSYIPQQSGISVSLSAREVVLMGFNPRLGVLQSPTAAMRAAADEALRHRRSGQQGRAGLPDAERRREAALYSGAHDCRGCAAALAGRAGQCA